MGARLFSWRKDVSRRKGRRDIVGEGRDMVWLRDSSVGGYEI